MRNPPDIDFEETARSAAHLIFSDAQTAGALLGGLEKTAAAPARRARWHHLRGQLDNELYQFEAAADHFNSAIALLETGGDRHLLADARLELAAVLTNLRRFAEAEEALSFTRAFVKKNGGPAMQAQLALRDAFLNLRQGNRDLALAQLLDAQRLMAKPEVAGEPRELASRVRIETGLYEIYQKNGDPERAAQASLDALKIAEPNGLRTRLPYLFLNAGRAFNSLGDFERAEAFFKKAEAVPGEAAREARASATANLGFLFSKKGLLDEAETHLRRAVDAFGEPGRPEDFSNLSLVEAFLAQIFLLKKEGDAAERHIERAVEFGQRGDNIGHAAEVCRTAAEYFALEKGDFEKAYAHSRLAEHLSRVQASEARDERLTEIQTRYDAENRRREAELARSQAVSLQLRALRAQMNPHFMFNALNSVQSLLMAGRSAEAGQWLVKFSRLMRRALDLSNAEAVSLEDEVEFLENYLEINQKLRFPGLTFSIEVDDEMEADFIKIPTMIVQPYVENAIEHGIKPRGGGHVRIAFFENDDRTLTCTVDDDGPGLREMLRRQAENPDPKKHRSRGREITEERLALLHRSAGRRVGEWVKTTDLSDLPGSQKTGTRVEIFIPEI